MQLVLLQLRLAYVPEPRDAAWLAREHWSARKTSQRRS